jgi:hypothetical protein
MHSLWPTICGQSTDRVARNKIFDTFCSSNSVNIFVSKLNPLNMFDICLPSASSAAAIH